MSLPTAASRLASRVTPALRPLRGRRVLPAVLAAALTLVVAGGAGAVGWAVLDRTVTLEVDGQAQDVRILGSEVSDVLAAAGVEVDERDLVSPAVGETVADGDEVVVRYARQLTVADPAGEERTYWTTELTVDDALAAIGLRHADAWLSTSRSASIGRSGLSLTMSVPKDLTVVADGRARTVTSAAPTVADLLDELGLTLGERDRLDPAPGTVLAAGGKVTIQRVQVKKVEESIELEHGSRTVESDDIYEGETEVVESGSDGEERVTYRVVLVDGEEESRKEVAREVVTEPVDRVVAEGTKERPAPEPVQAASSSGSSSSSSGSDDDDSDDSGGSSGGSAPAPVSSDVDSLNWGALAQCESGGSPTIVSSNGLYHGLYQFSVATWQSVGGSGLPSDAPASEQTARAKALYERAGVGQWPHCGPRLYS